VNQTGGVPQNLLNFHIAYRLEILIPFSNREERLRLGQTDALIRFPLQSFAGLRRADGRRDNHPEGLRAANTAGGGDHGRACREAVIYQQNGPPPQVRSRPVSAIQPFAALYLLHFPRGHGLHGFVGDAQTENQFPIKDSRVAGDCAHGELRLPWDAQFSDYEYVERRFQPFRYLGSNRHSAARQSQNDGIR
jgi:hypothetical protein